MAYEFVPAKQCVMCDSVRARQLGIRLNRSQGLRPRRVSGVAVTVKECLDCGLIFADPRPLPTDISEHYGVPPEEYWAAEEHWHLDSSYFAREIADAKRLLAFKPGMTALDIGAGLGKGMLSLERAGFAVQGIEPSEPFRDKAITRMGVPADKLLLSTLESAEFPSETFDFITFGAVLEHLQLPGPAIEKSMRWLKPGGIMQAEVPSSRHLIGKLINAYYKGIGLNYVTNLSPMHPPYHLYEFGLESFAKHGARVGYEVADHYFSVCSIYHFPKFTHSMLRWWMERTNRGMQLTVWLRKIH